MKSFPMLPMKLLETLNTPDSHVKNQPTCSSKIAPLKCLQQLVVAHVACLAAQTPEDSRMSGEKAPRVKRNGVFQPLFGPRDQGYVSFRGQTFGIFWWYQAKVSRILQCYPVSWNGTVSTRPVLRPIKPPNVSMYC